MGFFSTAAHLPWCMWFCHSRFEFVSGFGIRASRLPTYSLCGPSESVGGTSFLGTASAEKICSRECGTARRWRDWVGGSMESPKETKKGKKSGRFFFFFLRSFRQFRVLCRSGTTDQSGNRGIDERKRRDQPASVIKPNRLEGFLAVKEFYLPQIRVTTD